MGFTQVGKAVIFFIVIYMVDHALAAESGHSWNVGLAKTVITPDQPVWLSGYYSRNRLPDGKVHDLYAKAVAFESTSTGTRFVLVTCDLGSIYQELTDQIANAVYQQWKLPASNLVINVSHTHCAPEIAKERIVFHDLKPEEETKLANYIENELQPKLVRLIGDSLVDLKPATLHIGRASAEFGRSRRFPTEEGDVVNRRYDAGLTENEVPVMKITAGTGELRGILFGYACHNTTLAFYQFCGDYAGFAQEIVEMNNPGCLAMFVMGCGGDQNPYPRHGPRGLEYARQHGRELAAAVQRAVAGDLIEVHGSLRVASETVELELEPLPPVAQLEKEFQKGSGLGFRKAKYLLAQLKEHGKVDLTQSCPLIAARFGRELLFIAISGETVVDFSLRSKIEFAGKHMTWVAGYNNDVFAYLPSRRVLLEGGYEGRSSIVHQLVPTPFQTNVEDLVMQGIRRIVTKVSTEE